MALQKVYAVSFDQFAKPITHRVLRGGKQCARMCSRTADNDAPGCSSLLYIQAAPVTLEERSMEMRYEHPETQKRPDKLETSYINDEEALSQQSMSSRTGYSGNPSRYRRE